MIIALTGAKGVGKDHFASTLIKTNPSTFIRTTAFADPIKEDLMNIFRLTSVEEYDLLKRSIVTFGDGIEIHGRDLVRNYGMMKRASNPNQFVEYVTSQISACPQATWIITDLRFQNEIDWLKTRPDAVIIKIRGNGTHYDGHITETDLVADADCTYTLLNDGSLQDYDRMIAAVWKSLHNK